MELEVWSMKYDASVVSLPSSHLEHSMETDLFSVHCKEGLF